MFNQPNLIGANSTVGLAFLPPLAQARAAGPIDEYTFKEIKPKKKLREMCKVLNAEKKKFLFIKYGWKFNLKDRCIVCGAHHIWESGDYMRPPIPLSQVTKGRPMRGTYCPKHATHHRQLEMLQQQILADEHGLDFKAFIPKPRLPQVLSKGPLTNLTKADVISLIGFGWVITPPQTKGEESTLEEVVRLAIEIRLASERMNTLIEKGE
tara:strand:- start:1323 stop:1949 length:627 start_codon:yes stop_codon:yes gene_type:complete